MLSGKLDPNALCNNAAYQFSSVNQQSHVSCDMNLPKDDASNLIIDSGDLELHELVSQLRIKSFALKEAEEIEDDKGFPFPKFKKWCRIRI